VHAASTPRRIVLVFAVAALVLSLSGRGDSAGAAGSEPSTGALRICSGCASSGGDLSRYGYVILNAWDYAQIPTLRAKNPGIKVLVYANSAATYAYACHNGVDDALLSAGVGYCDADKNHPDWFLTDTSGARVEFCDYPGIWQMDVGSSGYQQAWLARVTSELKQYGWDGVMLDDVNSTAKYHLCGKTLAKYPTDSDYEAATRSFLAAVGPAIKSQGFLALPNINYDCWESCFSSFIQYTSGAVREWWTKNGTGYGGQYGDSGWDWANGFLRLTQQQGKIFIGITYAPKDDVRSQRYGRASFLLDWNGGPSAFMFEPVAEAQDPWTADATEDLGTPLAPKYQVGSAWRRDFTGGTVVVNPSSTATLSVSLNGAFLDASSATVTSVSLQPETAVILRSTVTSSATTSTTTPTSTSSTTSTTSSSSTTTTTAKTTTTTTPTSTTTSGTTTSPTSTVITLSAVFQGSRAVALTWKGATSAKVDLYRNGALRSTLANTGSTMDKVDKTLASSIVTYKICAAGTTTCSASVSVNFGTHRILPAGPTVS
jgi:hypothetical protein